MKPGASGDSAWLCPDPIQNSPSHLTALPPYAPIGLAGSARKGFRDTFNCLEGGPRSAPQQNNSFVFNRFRAVCTKHARATGIVSQGVLSALCAPLSFLSCPPSDHQTNAASPLTGLQWNLGRNMLHTQAARQVEHE